MSPRLPSPPILVSALALPTPAGLHALGPLLALASPLALGSLLALLALLAPVGHAHAGIVLLDPSADRPHDPTRTPLTLIREEVDVVIVDQVARTSLVQVFRNDTAAPVAGTYLLPLGERASVEEYAFWVDGRRVVSRVAEKAAAQQVFDGAAARSEDAALLEQRDPNTFTARFTTLNPGETRRFEVTTSELLPYEAGLVRYSHPLDYASLGLPPVDELYVRVSIEDSKPIAALTRSSFPVRERREADKLLVDFASRGTTPATDFELEYRLESQDFGFAVRTYAEEGDEGYFVAMVAPQEETTDAAIVRKDVAFVFDVSGSMSGTKIDEARRALKACLNLMNPGDGLHIVAFNDAMNPFQSAVAELDERLRREATQFVDGLVASGGTNILDAVVSTLDALRASERPTALVFLTDGLGQRPPEETLAAIEAHNPGDRTRIFAFGVGQDVNRAFLERMGTENRGAFTAIDGSVAIDAMVAEFYSRIARPVLTDLRFDFGDGVVANRTYPAVMPDVYAGQRLVVTGRYRGHGDRTLRVTGRIGGEERELAVPVRFGDGAGKDDGAFPFVGRLWGKRRAEHLLAEIRMYGESPEARDEVIALSTRWSFATPYTSLVAHADPRVASLSPARIKPGDPVLKIPAPASATAVTAFLPFGEVKDLVWDGQETVWTTRFLVPRSAQDGVYWIHVVVTERDGDTSWFRVAYTVDTKAPVLRVELRDAGRVMAGALLAVRARPVVGFLELGTEMVAALGRDAAARAKAFVDVKRVVARIPGLGIEEELRSSPDAEAGWHGLLDLPPGTPPGRYTLEVTATDVAGNRHMVRELIEVVTPALSVVIDARGHASVGARDGAAGDLGGDAGTPPDERRTSESNEVPQ